MNWTPVTISTPFPGTPILVWDSEEQVVRIQDQLTHATRFWMHLPQFPGDRVTSWLDGRAPDPVTWEEDVSRLPATVPLAYAAEMMCHLLQQLGYPAHKLMERTI